MLELAVAIVEIAAVGGVGDIKKITFVVFNDESVMTTDLCGRNEVIFASGQRSAGDIFDLEVRIGTIDRCGSVRVRNVNADGAAGSVWPESNGPGLDRRESNRPVGYGLG